MNFEENFRADSKNFEISAIFDENFKANLIFFANLNKFWKKSQRTERISAKISNFNKFRQILPDFVNFERKGKQT